MSRSVAFGRRYRSLPVCLLLGGLACLLLAACAGSGKPVAGVGKQPLQAPRTPPITEHAVLSPPLLREERVYLAYHFTAVLNRVDGYYVDSVDRRAFAAAGLNALAAYEQSLRAHVGADSVALSIGSQTRYYPYQSYPGQPDRSRVSLALAMARAASEARTRSPLLARLSTARLEDSMMDGALASLDDMSYYLGPDEVRSITQRAAAGIGVEVEAGYDRLAIVRVMPNGPAYAAGLRPGDSITRIAGQGVIGLPAYHSSGLLYGAPGSQLRLAVIQDGKPRRLTLTRRVVAHDDVDAHWLADNLLYVKIHHFGSRTVKAFDAHWATLTHGHAAPRGIVLDLRGNPGGVLRSATAIVDEFIDAGVIMRVEGRDGEVGGTLRARPKARTTTMPMVILVDGMTASAAEVMSAALQDHARAVLVGSRSYGMGMMKGLFRVAPGVGMQLTTARIYRPARTLLHKHGVTPDICTAETARDHVRVERLIAQAMRIPRAPCVREIDSARGRDLELDVAVRLLHDMASYRHLLAIH